MKTSMDNFRRRVRFSLIFIAASFVLLGGGLAWLSYGLSDQAQRIVDDRVQLDQRAALLGSLAALKDAAPAAANYEKAMELLMPTQDQLLDFPHTLDNLAKVDQVSLSFSFQGGQVAPQGANPGYVTFSLNAGGSADNLTNFLKDAEVRASKFLVAFNSFSLSRNGDGSYSVMAQGQLFFR